MRKFDNYSTRFLEHQNSLKFARKRIEDIENQLLDTNKLFPYNGPKDFQFLLDVAELVYAARRAIAYTYVERFYLRGTAKKGFFDFIQQDLERSLEWLNKHNEEDWLEYCEKDL